MKTLFTFILIATSVEANAATFQYNCMGDFTYQLTVLSKTKVAIADESGTANSLSVDTKYARANPEKKSVRLLGSATVMGDGEEGYTVYPTLSKIMLTGSQLGYLNKTAYGPDGGYSESYKCKRVK